MRFAIICLSLLFVPALAASGHQRRSSPPPPYRKDPPPYRKDPPPPPEQHPPPRHGDLVYYEGPHGINSAIALGSQPDRHGYHDLAPFRPFGHHPPGRLAVHHDQVVKARPGDIDTKPNNKMPHIATHLMNGHASTKPQVSYALGPVQNSPNDISEHGGK